MTPSSTDCGEALTFDDILLVPGKSEVLPKDVDTSTRFSRHIPLKIPFCAAAMDTVSESKMAIAMAQAGGIAVIHKNLSIAEQAAQLRRVKKFESGMVVDPVTIHPDQKLGEAIALKSTYRISGIPVVERNNGRLVGILTNRDMRFANDPQESVDSLMTRDNLITASETIGKEEAKRLLHKHRIEKLLVVDDQYRCIGLITVKDIEKSESHPNACKDDKGRLRVAGAIGVGQAGVERAEALIKEAADAIVIDTAHGHSRSVIDTFKNVRKLGKNFDIIVGNIATAEAAQDLLKLGVDGLKIGIGPGSICTTRIIAGVGVPQFSAIYEVCQACKESDVPIIADGGVRYSGDGAKAIAAGADSVMIGSLLAGTDESPGDVFLYQGRPYKSYRGMGSETAMRKGSSDRYFQDDLDAHTALIPEGIEGRVPYKGPASGVLHQLNGGLRAAMGYVGAKDIIHMRRKARWCRITSAGMRESHVHDVTITRESPNYRPREDGER